MKLHCCEILVPTLSLEQWQEGILSWVMLFCRILGFACVLLVCLGTFCFDLVLCIFGMDLSITGTLNRKCQPFFHFLPEISDVQRMAKLPSFSQWPKRNYWKNWTWIFWCPYHLFWWGYFPRSLIGIIMRGKWSQYGQTIEDLLIVLPNPQQ